jgi:hypothetical protein
MHRRHQEVDQKVSGGFSSGREGLWEGVVRKKVRGTQGGQNERDGLDEHSARRTSRYISYYMLLCYMSRTGNNKPYSKVPK